MWTFNTDYNKWVTVSDKISKSNFDYLKQELASTRFYSKCLSGATYLPINNLDNIYDILGEYEPRDWFINSVGSPYSSGAFPINSKYRSPITSLTSYDYYEKYVSEYGLTLKNLFTPDRLIKDSVKNFIYVDLATNILIVDLGATFNELFIDGVRVLDGHRILVKDQVSTTTLPFDRDPNTYFKGNYTVVQDYGATIEYSFYNSDNGIYTFNKGRLYKTTELSDYADCIRYSVSVKLGNINTEKQFHLSRLLNGYYPTTSLNEPIEFKPKHNWLLRNRVDYNNLFDINYYDVVKYTEQSYYLDGVTYSIPERTIAVGEFGVILNTQKGLSNIIPNKYKINLRSISQTEKYYWICGDDGILLKVRKHDFVIEKIDTGVISNLKSVSFYNDLKGVIVGDLNTILIISDGLTCNKIIVDDFSSHYYNKAIFYSSSNIYIVGNSGVFLELKEDIQGWDVYKRRVSRFIDDFEEYLLVDNINDMYITKESNWGLSFSYSDQGCLPDKEILLLTTAENKIIIYDINSSIPNFDFIYLSFRENYGDIKSITRFEGSGTSSNLFYFSWLKSNGEAGISSFNLSSFEYVGIDNIYSNTSSSSQTAQPESNLYVNKIFNYNGTELLVCGNSSLLLKSSYGNTLTFNGLDATFESRIKSKMLFLDYDIASKLNFFTDAGDYRLPNTTKFYLGSSSSNFSISSTSSSSPLITNTSTVNTITISNSNPIPLNIEVFLNLDTTSINRLLVNLMTPSGKIINLKRNNSGVGSTFSNTKFCTNTNYTYFSHTPDISYNNQKYQMDKILGIGGIGWISNTNTFSELFVGSSINGSWKLYIDIIEPHIVWDPQYDELSRSIPRSIPVPFGHPVTIIPHNPAGTFSNWGINFIYQDINIVSLTNTSSNLWFEPLVHGATAPSFMTQSETNWLTYWKDTEKTFRYYAGGTASPLDESTKVLISTTFSYFTNSGSFSVTSDSVTDSITQLQRLAPPSIDFEQSKFNGLNLTSITYPTESYNIYLKDSIMIIKVPTTYPVRVGDVIRLESDVVDGNFVVNRISQLSFPLILPQNQLNQQFRPSNPTFNYIYMFTNFNENIITNLTKTSNLINIINLNKYKTVPELKNNFNLHPISNGYNLKYTPPGLEAESIEISAKFNNLTSYYNLGTNVFVNDNLKTVTGTMSYTSGFLKFGYTPTYNLLDYLEQLDDLTSPKFSATKEYLAMPDYRSIPMENGLGQQTSQVYVEYNNTTQQNRIYFGKDLRLEWESIFINTFVDITIYSNNLPKDSERLLVMKKGIVNHDVIIDNYPNAGYFIDFHKSLNYVIQVPPTMMDIKSRRTLLQISQDLQELNNIQRGLLKKKNLVLGSEFYNYERDLNFKIPTDSYAKILLSDVDTIKELSALIYVDYKNELAMNITRLAKEYNIPIIGTTNYNSKVLVICKYNHDLKTGDSVTLEFNGGTFSSQLLNQQYFGYQNVTVVDTTKFSIDLPYGNINAVGDTGFVKYVKRDPFLNYQPVDIIDIGVDKRGKNAIELSIDNLKLSGDVYSLVNVDFNKFRFRLVDGLTVEKISLSYPWILEAEITDAIIGTDGSGIVWYKGNWECGRWFGGTWMSGVWKSGDWYGGTWNAKKIKDNLISVEVGNNTSDKTLSTWFSGRWYDGTWNDGVWVDGRWYGGTWNTGDWYKGTWNDGIWNDGEFSGGVWLTGTWNKGILNCNNDPTFWVDGKWNGGDFENGIWYKGIFEEKNELARFGTKAFNSRTATWHSGQWLSGSFYSKMMLDNNDQLEVSLSHKYSIWHTGSWYSGDIYGGIVYNIDFKSGVWHGGISEEIQIIQVGLNTTVPNNSYLKLNGIFRFNIGDEINIVSKENQYSSNGLPYSRYFNRVRYKVIYAEDPDLDNKTTKIYFDSDSQFDYDDSLYNNIKVETKMRIVSRFRNTDWRSGIWTNGIFETGYWQGGIWYDGTFGEKAKWS